MLTASTDRLFFFFSSRLAPVCLDAFPRSQPSGYAGIKTCTKCPEERRREVKAVVYVNVRKTTDYHHRQALGYWKTDYCQVITDRSSAHTLTNHKCFSLGSELDSLTFTLQTIHSQTHTHTPCPSVHTVLTLSQLSTPCIPSLLSIYRL